MNESLVALLTAVPILLVAHHGYRVGVRYLLLKVLGIVLPCSSGFALAYGAIHLGWFEPLGLLTPFLMGLLAMLLCWWCLRSTFRGTRLADSRPNLPAVRRIAGLALGAVFGAVSAAGLWTVSSLLTAIVLTKDPVRRVEPRAACPEPAAESALTALLQTAHRGFVRHLPWIGPLSDEVEALIFIVGTDLEVRREFANRRGWHGLAELPAFHALLANGEVMREVERAGEGDLQALYRLQKHPLILALCEEDAIMAIVRGTHPTTMARELAEFQRASRVK